MAFLDLLKVSLAWLIDLLNRVYDPFRPFTRSQHVKYPETLGAKATKFAHDFLDNFWVLDRFWSYKLPIDAGDQCLWHGVYTAMWALAYSMVGPIADFSRLEDCGKGLAAHQPARPDGSHYLIRGLDANGAIVADASNDQASGHILGLYFLWAYGNNACRTVARTLIAQLADELLASNECLINADGSPTTYGKLVNGALTDPLSLTLALAVYRVAYRLLGDDRYIERYNTLASTYKLILPYADMRLWWWEQTSVPMRAAIHYSILCDLETDPRLRNKYLAGLRRTWRMERKGANPFVYYLYRRVERGYVGDEPNVKKHLFEMTLEDKQWNVERINSPSVECFSWGGHLRARQPIPRWMAGAQDFFWQRHMFSVDDWAGNKTGDTRYNGGDFLIAYWGLRSLGIVRPEE